MLGFGFDAQNVIKNEFPAGDNFPLQLVKSVLAINFLLSKMVKTDEIRKDRLIMSLYIWSKACLD